MPSWWGKSSSKEAKSKAAKESFIDTIHKKFKSPETKPSSRSGVLRRRTSDTVSERGSQSRIQSRSPSPSKNVARCQSFAERPQAQPLPLPTRRPANVSRTDSGISESAKPKQEKVSKSSLFRPFSRPSCIRCRPEHTDLHSESAVASVFSEGSDDSDDPIDSQHDNGCRAAADISSSNSVKDLSTVAPVSSRESPISVNLTFAKNVSASPPRRRQLKGQVPNLQVPPHGAFFSAPDSSMSSPSRSPMRVPYYEQVTNTAFTTGKIYPDFPLLGSGQCSSPGSGQTSGHNSMGGDMSGQLFWMPSRGSPEYSPNPSPRMVSPGPSSRIHSGAVTPLHPRSGGVHSESQSNWPDDAKQQSHRLPLPPLVISNSPFSHQNSAATSPSVPRSPGRAENLPSPPGSRWKKGKLLGRGTFGHVYVGFNSETGEMCAMKEVTLFADDAKSKESAKQLAQEIALLSRLRHPNVVQYYGSETVDDKLYIYLEYVSGGSIHKILQEYGKLGESAIRSYTQQILSGLAYLHAKNTVHRDIKGANILVDPNGRRVKLADFGMAKHITGQSCPLSFKGSPYWMAPEVIRNLNGCTLAVDIWSLGCTVLEMATSKPPWSQYEGVAAMFKIGNSKELPSIPNYLSDEGKEFVRLCLQRNPLQRPTAAQLLEHPFVKSAAPLEKQLPSYAPSDHPAVLNAVKSGGVGSTRISQQPDTERLAIHSSRVSKSNFHSSDIYMSRNISCPVSPVGSPLLHPRSPQHLSGRMSPSPMSSPRTTSGSSTPLTGGIGAVPFHSQLMPPHDCFGNSNPPMRPCSSPCANTISYWDPDLLRGVHPGSNAFRELASYDNDALGKQFGTTLSADRVSQQLLRDPVVELNQPFDLPPLSPLPSHRL
ncbi:mitogen-activated protein kinase kinase kinase YODA-like [Andrographis paniculata]|uniref:mitogen-activated protein kinase kinase kinase YODA-like n=1 Tax=Andrographis paniculata TaxID=175694 RepID=UPI0021E90737|nr:mitogen-activated protein kinase kinase kinase YODA-like [Andrographis paniculata]